MNADRGQALTYCVGSNRVDQTVFAARTYKNISSVGQMFSALFARIGESDCELLESGLLAQPVNAVSSLAYSLVGVALVFWAFRVSGHFRIIRITFGALMVTTGMGSVVFHGPQGWGSQFFHDITFLSALLFLAVFNFTAAKSAKVPIAWMSFSTLWLTIAILLVASPGATNAVMVLAVVGIVVSDVVLFRNKARWTRWYLTALITAGAAVAMFLLGRTGGPMCDPTGAFQGHAVWHVLGAAALGAYFVATTAIREERTEGSNP